MPAREVKAYRDQVAWFQENLEKLCKDKNLTLKEASEQLGGNVAPVVADRAQLASVTVCVEIGEAPKADKKADPDGSEETNDTDPTAN